ncbi:MAG: type II secretion system protein GspM [Pseudomonadales bacterium]
MNALNLMFDRLALSWNSVQTLPMAQHLVARYRGLRDRDQWALKVLAVFTVLVLTYAVLLKPAHDYAEGARDAAERQQTTLSWMEANSALFNSGAQSSVQRKEGQTLLGTASELAKFWGIGFKRFEPVDETSMRVWLEGVSFENLIQWIAGLHSNHNITVREIQLDQQSDGVLSASLTLQE